MNKIKPAKEIAFASFIEQPPPFITQKKVPQLTKVQKDGLRYEKRVQTYLRNLRGDDGDFTLLCNPWVMFRSFSSPSGAISFCQPDCILVSKNKKHVIIVEIKLSHTADSWNQLRRLYEPVLRKIYDPYTQFSLLEICKWFDPHTAFPETFYYEENVFNAKVGKFGVHIYKPRGREAMSRKLS